MGWVVGVCRHTGAWGHGVAAPTPSRPVPPGTGVCQVCSAWPSSTVPAAVPRGGLRAQGATQLLVVLVQKQSHHGGVPQACSASCQSTTATQCRWPEECPTLLGCSTVAQPREHQPGHEELLVSTTPRVNWVLFCPAGRDSPGGTKGRWEQPAPICHSQILSNQSYFLLHPATGLCRQGGKKQKALGLSRADDAASDTVPSQQCRRCRGGGTRQAACEGWYPSLFHLLSDGAERLLTNGCS